MNKAHSTPERILMIRPSALGDICRTVPVLVSLRKAYPDSQIDWVVQDTFIEAIQAHPDLSTPIPFPRDRFSRWWHSPRIMAELIAWLRVIRKTEYDLVFDLQGLSRSGLITWATRAPARVGYQNARELSWFSYNIRSPRPQTTHIVDQMLELVSSYGVEAIADTSLYVHDEHLEKYNQIATQHGLSGTRYAVLAPTSRWDSKRWPIESWAGIVSPLLERGFGNIVMTGAPSEQEQISEFSSNLDPTARTHVIDLVGKLSIGQTMAAIAGSQLVIANDSAPLHMAVGFERPLVGLFGPTDPGFVGPYGHETSVIRAHQPAQENNRQYRNTSIGNQLMCMISHDMVLSRIDQVLSSTLNQLDQTKTEQTLSTPTTQ